MDLYFLFVIGFLFSVFVFLLSGFWLLKMFFKGELNDSEKLRKYYLERLEKETRDYGVWEYKKNKK
jgi:hypothetical protein